MAQHVGVERAIRPTAAATPPVPPSAAATPALPLPLGRGVIAGGGGGRGAIAWEDGGAPRSPPLAPVRVAAEETDDEAAEAGGRLVRGRG